MSKEKTYTPEVKIRDMLFKELGDAVKANFKSHKCPQCKFGFLLSLKHSIICPFCQLKVIMK